MMKAKLIVILVLVVLVAVILVQNPEKVPFRLLFWGGEISKVILVPGVFFLGLVFGLILAYVGRRRRSFPAGPSAERERREKDF